MKSLALWRLEQREFLRDYEDCAETMHTIELNCLDSVGAMDDLIRHDMDTTSVMSTNERFFKFISGPVAGPDLRRGE